jgi:hypothetical protein
MQQLLNGATKPPVLPSMLFRCWRRVETKDYRSTYTPDDCGMICLDRGDIKLGRDRLPSDVVMQRFYIKREEGNDGLSMRVAHSSVPVVVGQDGFTSDGKFVPM